MSGEIVIIAAFGPAALPVAAGLAALTIAKIVAKCKEQAAIEKAIQKREMTRWAEFKEQQKNKLEEVQKIQAAVREAAQAVSSLKMTRPSRQQAGVQASSTARGFLDLGRTPSPRADEVKPLLEQTAAVLDSLPAVFKADSEWPFSSFQTQQKRYLDGSETGHPPRPEELHDFNTTIAQTLARYNKELSDRRQAGQEYLTRAEAALDDILFYLQLAMREEHRAELTALKEKLSPAAGDVSLDWSSLDLAEKRLAVIKEDIERDQQKRAYQHTLADSIQHHLEEMGYQTRQPFEAPDGMTDRQAILTGPGGGRLESRLHEDGRLSFEIFPDRPGLLSAEEIKDYRQQEEAWCSHFPELMRRLSRDGFSFNLLSEKLKPEEAISVVHWETADEISAEEEEETFRSETRRYFDR